MCPGRVSQGLWLHLCRPHDVARPPFHGMRKRGPSPWLQDVARELAFHAPLCVHLSTAESLRHAQSPRFRIQECHMEVGSALAQLQSLATSPLATCLRSITLSDWSVVHTGILLWIQTAVDEGAPSSRLHAS